MACVYVRFQPLFAVGTFARLTRKLNSVRYARNRPQYLLVCFLYVWNCWSVAAKVCNRWLCVCHIREVVRECWVYCQWCAYWVGGFESERIIVWVIFEFIDCCYKKLMQIPHRLHIFIMYILRVEPYKRYILNIYIPYVHSNQMF